MGGLMGVMMAYMIPKIGLYTVVILLTILFALTWFFLRRRIDQYVIQTNFKQYENNLQHKQDSFGL